MNKHLRNLPQQATAALLQYFNACWERGKLPAAWKHSEITMIPKPNKQLSIENLRPISPTSCLGKLFEHMIHKRLTSYLEENGYFANTMFGFRQNLSTQDVFLLLKEDLIDHLIPQQPPVIKDSKGNQLRAIAGPYAEGDTVMLTCAVPAAGHKLTLAWRRNGQPLVSPAATFATPSGGWENRLDLGPLLREDLYANVSCVATSDVTLPAQSSVLIDMFLPPAEVSLRSWHHDDVDASGWLMAAPSATGTTSSARASTSVLEPKTGSSHLSQGASRPPNTDPDSAADFYAPRSFECEATGSRPPANISWFLDGMPLDVRSSHTRTGGNVTASVLLLPPQMHAGKLLECRASNDNLRDHRGVISRYSALNVSSKPEVSIKLGTGLNASRITEGVDVYMECSVLVTSRIAHVKWSRDGQELDADLAEGIVMTSRYLVIRGVTPGHAGSYTCRVTSTHGGTVESTPLLIHVRCKQPITHCSVSLTMAFGC
ncbi:uncharacterized protein LOC142558341 [Dermacentor variabilis]|uniref:uncharacterized protein LOC142558341 n=1 Tax=Dermacentor variabilis TaxID=34621 RepID=UPI003F5C272B